MTFSVIIPVFNSMRHIRQTLESVLDQQNADFEVILVDDGSTDESLSLLMEYAAKDGRVKVLHQQNMGPGLARKAGFEAATGELLYFVDSDDLLADSQVLSDITAFYLKYPFEVLFLDTALRRPGKTVLLHALRNPGLSEGIHDIDDINGCIVAGALYQKVFIREKMEGAFFHRSSSQEDTFTTFRYLETCKSFHVYKRTSYLINRTDNPDSLSRNVTAAKIIDAADVLSRLFENTLLLRAKQLRAYDYYIYAMKFLLRNRGLYNRAAALRALVSLRRTFFWTGGEAQPDAMAAQAPAVLLGDTSCRALNYLRRSKWRELWFRARGTWGL